MSDGRALLAQLKEAAGNPGPALGLRVPGFDSCFLRPVACQAELLNAHDVARLTEWRNRYVRAFLTEFEASTARTARWLSQYVQSDDGRILFMIDDASGRPIGYMGIAYIDWDTSYVEADAIVSNGNTPRGLMSAALCTMLRWAQGQLGLRNVAVRVLSDNPALHFYSKLGFVEVKRVPLRRDVQPGMISWVEDPSLTEAERYLVHHVWSDDESRN